MNSNDFRPISTCPNHAVYLIKTPYGLEKICKPCLVERHCGGDFSLMHEIAIDQCECRCMPEKREGEVR